MRRRTVSSFLSSVVLPTAISTLGIAMFCLAFTTQAAGADDPIQIGSQLELFTDMGLVESFSGRAELELHHLLWQLNARPGREEDNNIGDPGAFLEEGRSNRKGDIERTSG